MDDQRVDREGGAGVEPSGFSLKQLFVSFTMVAVGLAIGKIGWSHRGSLDFVFPLFFLSGPLIGAGLLMPNRRPLIGATVGFVLQLPTIGLIASLASRALN